MPQVGDCDESGSRTVDPAPRPWEASSASTVAGRSCRVSNDGPGTRPRLNVTSALSEKEGRRRLSPWPGGLTAGETREEANRTAGVMTAPGVAPGMSARWMRLDSLFRVP
jgi:hypothetical protein